MSDLVGQTLAGRYRVDAFIGRGGMAEVYKVWDTRRSTHLAMKLLREDLAIDRVFLRRFTREAQTLALLQHPNIVRFYGLEQDGPYAFLLMDFIEGKSLKREIFDAKGPLETERVLEIMRPLCSALSYAHNEGLVHCDVKPGNVMIHQNGTVLLADFGIARMTDAATATMVGFGTPAYMAPELVRGEEPTPKTDIYALGVVLFEMLTGGERPFMGDRAKIEGSTSDKVRWEQANLKPPSPKAWNKEVSPAMEALVLRCLAKKPDRRHGGAVELFNAMMVAAYPGDDSISPRLLIEREQPGLTKPLPPKVMPAKSPIKAPVRSKKAWVGIASAGVLIVALGCAAGAIALMAADKKSLPEPTEVRTQVFPTEHPQEATATHVPTPTIAPTPTKEQPRAVIMFPGDRSLVNRKIDVTGTISGLEPGMRAFLCIQSTAFGELIWPQGEIFSEAYGNWEVLGIYQTVGYDYRTFVVVTQNPASAEMLADQTNRALGMEELPEDTTIISSIITVRRE